MSAADEPKAPNAGDAPAVFGGDESASGRGVDGSDRSGSDGGGDAKMDSSDETGVPVERPAGRLFTDQEMEDARLAAQVTEAQLALKIATEAAVARLEGGSTLSPSVRAALGHVIDVVAVVRTIVEMIPVAGLGVLGQQKQQLSADARQRILDGLALIETAVTAVKALP